MMLTLIFDCLSLYINTKEDIFIIYKLTKFIKFAT